MAKRVLEGTRGEGGAARPGEVGESASTPPTRIMNIASGSVVGVSVAQFTAEPNLGIRHLSKARDHHARAAGGARPWITGSPRSTTDFRCPAGGRGANSIIRRFAWKRCCELAPFKFPKQRSVELAMQALERPLDQLLDYALWQTVRELEPCWLPALEQGELTFAATCGICLALQAINAPQTVQTLLNLSNLVKCKKTRKKQCAGADRRGLGGASELALVFDHAAPATAPRAAGPVAGRTGEGGSPTQCQTRRRTWRPARRCSSRIPNR